MKNFTAADAAELPNVRLVSHPLIEHKLAILRDASTPTFQFRMLVDEISHLMIFEATRDLALKNVSVQTPVAQAQAKKLATKVMICPILRAALGMLESVFKIIPNASVGFLGFQRNENPTAVAAVYAVEFLREKGVKRIKFISVIAAPEGLKRFSEIYPDVSVYTAAIDERLNEKNYIVPGLGDAGDRVFNTL